MTWPKFDTVTARALPILVVSLIAVNAVGYWGYSTGIEKMATSARDHALAERIITIKRAIAGTSDPVGRDRAAHALSSASLEVHWSEISLVMETAVANNRTVEMATRLRQLAPELAEEDFRIGFADEGLDNVNNSIPFQHLLRLSSQLGDKTWINFSSPTLGSAPHLDWNLLSVTLFAGCVIIALAMMLLRRVTRPLTYLAAAAERFSLVETPEPLPESGPAEIRHAAHAFNKMRERVVRLVAERTRALAAVSHDLRTPITRLRLRSEQLEDPLMRDLFDADLAEMDSMINSTLEFLRAGKTPETVRTIDIVSILETIVGDHVDNGCQISLHGSEHALVLGRILSLKRAFWNIVGNALKYGSIVKIIVTADYERVCIAVNDDGPGIPPEHLEQVFEAFYRVEDSRSRETGGSGLGLTIARSIFIAHGGTIELCNLLTGGLTANICLPRYRSGFQANAMP